MVSDSDASSYTKDGSLDYHGQPAVKWRTGGWRCGFLLLVNQGLANLAFAGVEVNMVLFAKSVFRQTDEEAANTFSSWTGTLYISSLIGAFLSDSYRRIGRYLTCVVFQVVSVIEMASLNLHLLLNATFGADQFDEEDPKEKQSKSSFYSYFYVALNLGCLFSETVLAYVENIGYWVLGFWICTGSAIFAFLLQLSGTFRYRCFRPSGNPLSRFSQVIVASFRKINLQVPSNGEELYEVYEKENETISSQRIVHTNDFKFLDRAAIMTPVEMTMTATNNGRNLNPWQLCTITQVEEVKCILRLLPVWLCTIFSPLAFTQMIGLFIEQGAAMDTKISNFQIPPASMTSFDIISTTAFILLYNKLIVPLYVKLIKTEPKTPSELQRIGIGLSIAILAMLIASMVEQHRLKNASENGQETSSLSILWQTPQYIGVAEAFLFVAQMEFFSSQIPDGLKSLGIALSMSSTAIGSYVCSMILTVVMAITTKNGEPGWVPPNLNDGHLDRFFFLCAGLIALNLVFFIICAKCYKCISMEKWEEAQASELKAML
ncbi:hypothetical protein LWI28_025900 [Acer negundo]|uniref:Uncharacterized protein n=1 Tax=Acer negundo TaxID=4023 RepID=A0AAD5J2F7_ACENE|nr:hypothetical protein LWI28_025900 [Acer negundo]